LATRVLEGGHNIPPKVIERRYNNGINNLFKTYLPLVDNALIFDNSDGIHAHIASKEIDNDIQIINQDKFNLLKTYYDSRR